MMSKSPVSSRDVELLSAYLDRQLSRFQRQRLETRLQKSEALRTTLDDLRRTRAMLRTLPSLHAPRNFTLTSAMAGVQARPNRLPALGFGLVSALASFLLVMILAGDWMLGATRGRLFAPKQVPETQAVLSAFEQKESAGALQATTSTPEAAQAMAEKQALPTQAPGMSADLAPPTPSPESPMLELQKVAPAPAGGAGTLVATEAVTPTEAPNLAMPAAQETLPVVTPAPSEPEATAFAAVSAAGPTPTPTEQSTKRVFGIGSTGKRLLFSLAEITLALIALISGGLALFLRYRSG